MSAVLLALVSGTVFAEVTIDNIVEKENRAIVRYTYKNESGDTHSTVKIECSAGGGGSKRDKGIAYLNNHFGGGIKPGYSVSGTVEVNLVDAKAEDITCKDIPRPVVLK